jgi:hypothetical protein
VETQNWTWQMEQPSKLFKNDIAVFQRNLSDFGLAMSDLSQFRDPFRELNNQPALAFKRKCSKNYSSL